VTQPPRVQDSLLPKESVLDFACEGTPLVGILAEPTSGKLADTGVLIIVGGPQYRAGSHRQFTLLARHLAGNGFATLRFDYRGMGDSPGEARDFLAVDADIAAAIDALMAARPALRRVALWGLCDAASAALLYLQTRKDPRVAAVSLANPWVRSAASIAKTHVKHYYWQRLRQREFWMKLLRGGVGIRAFGALGANLHKAASRGSASGFQDRMAQGLRDFDAPVLIALSGDDYTAKEFVDLSASSPAWQGLLDRPKLQKLLFQDVDHTFSNGVATKELNDATSAWLLSHFCHHQTADVQDLPPHSA
jgi:exosortase A-associated hydrolase 1